MSIDSTQSNQSNSATAAALGKGKMLDFLGEQKYIEPLDWNDMADLELVIGDIEAFDYLKVNHQRLLLWLVLRKADTTLTPDQRRYCNYNLALQDVGRMLSARQLSDPRMLIFIVEVLKISGLFGDAEQEGAAQGNAPEAASNLDSTSLPSSSSSAVATPTRRSGARPGRSSKTS